MEKLVVDVLQEFGYDHEPSTKCYVQSFELETFRCGEKIGLH